MLPSLTIILLFQVAGDFLQHITAVQIPGPVLGMVLLLGALVVHGSLPKALDVAASGLLSYLPLLFVPAGVGIVAHLDLIRGHLAAIAIALVVSSILTVAVTALAMQTVERFQAALARANAQPAARPVIAKAK